MKVFVSGQLSEKLKIRDIYKLLEQQGHSVTHDWTKSDDLVGPYSTGESEASLRAQRDIEGVLHAEAYVILTDNQKCGKGMYVELGAALAMASNNQIRDVAIVGPKNYESIFYYHPSLTHFEDINEYLAHLERVSEELTKPHLKKSYLV